MSFADEKSCDETEAITFYLLRLIIPNYNNLPPYYHNFLFKIIINNKKVLRNFFRKKFPIFDS